MCRALMWERERGVFMWTPQRKRSLQHTHTHLFMLADTRRRRRLQNAHIGIFSRFSDLTCMSPQDLTYEHMLFNSKTCWLHWAFPSIHFTSHRLTCAERWFSFTPMLFSVFYCNHYESHNPIWSCIIMAAISVHANLIQHI